jgi:ABC-2 type transport system permease protein
MPSRNEAVTTLRKMSWLELKLFGREPLTVIFTLALPIILLFILGGVFGNTPDPEGVVFRGRGPIDFYVPAYISLVIASLGLIGLPVHLAAYRERGVLRRFRASSVGLPNILGSQAVVMFIMAVLGGLLLIIVAATVYELSPPSSWLLSIPAFILSTLCFASIGVMLGSLLPTSRAAQGVGVLLWFVMIFISGAGPPPEVLTTALRGAARVMPLTHTVRLLQDPWLGFGWNWTETLIVVAVTIGAALISLRFFRWESRRR